MRDIDKYSYDALTGASYHVIKYEREEKSYGITTITYDLMPGKHLHWLSIPTLGLFTGACLIANGIQVAVGTARVLYFDTSSGDRLGNSREEASNLASKKGFDSFSDSSYSEARDWFEKAYFIATAGDLEKSYKRNRDAIDSILAGKKLFSEQNFFEAAEQFQKAHDTTSTEAVRNRCLLLKKECAPSIYKQGKDLYNQAWEAENDLTADRSDESQKLFQEAKLKFEQAKEIESETEYLLWGQLCDLKIEGNELFNEGIALQQQGNKLKQQGLYHKAVVKYRRAEAKFRQGLCSDQRFQACIDLIQESKIEVTQLIHNLNQEQLTTVLTGLDVSENAESASDLEVSQDIYAPVQPAYTTKINP